MRSRKFKTKMEMEMEIILICLSEYTILSPDKYYHKFAKIQFDGELTQIAVHTILLLIGRKNSLQGSRYFIFTAAYQL